MPCRIILFLALCIQYSYCIEKQSLLCRTFDPFRIQPDNAKYEIGGTFALHESDCTNVRVDAVEDVIAIQWALTHWNHNSNKSHAKIGLFAGDSCSRPKESLMQSLRFLEAVGYNDPEECISESGQRGARFLGLLMPKDYDSASLLASSLRYSSIPMVSYTTFSSQALINNDINRFITTAPTLSSFVEVFVRLMETLGSDLTAIVHDGSHFATISGLPDMLKTNGVYVAEIVSVNDPLLSKIINESESKIVLSLMGKNQLVDILTRPYFELNSKLWVAIQVDSEHLTLDEQLFILMRNTEIQAIVLQQTQKRLDEFGQYFQRVLKNNYQSYSLLSKYMRQVYNCSWTGNSEDEDDCSALDSDEIESKYKQSTSVEPAVLAAYGLALVGSAVSRSTESDKICQWPSKACTDRIFNEFEELDYNFINGDPQQLIGRNARFRRTTDNILMLDGILIEGIELANNDRYGPVMAKAIEYETGPKPRFVSKQLHIKNFTSKCILYHPFCHNCLNTVHVKQQKYYLPAPREYPIYLMGLFDLHSGHSCKQFAESDISLPLAFTYATSTFRARYSGKNLLQNLEVGALTADSCSNAKNAIETVIMSDEHCFSFEQSYRNVTIVPNAIFGYLSGTSEMINDAINGLFTYGDDLLLSLEPNLHDHMNIFKTTPSNKNQAIAVYKILKKFQWEFITVVLSEKDKFSSASFHEFEDIANKHGICIAYVVKIVDGKVPNSVPLLGTNVTVFFATASDTSNFFNAAFRRGTYHSRAHIVLGDAHDLYLADPSNIANFIGTISIQAKNRIMPEFREWLENVTPLTFSDLWYWNYVEKHWHCALSTSRHKMYDEKLCTGSEHLDVPGLGRMTRAGYLALMIDQYLLAVDLAYKKLCPQQLGVCDEFYRDGKKLIRNSMKKIQLDDSFEIYEFLPQENGKIGYQKLGNWSLKYGVNFEHEIQYFDFMQNLHSSEKIRSERIVSRCVAPLCMCSNSFMANRFNIDALSLDDTGGSYIRSEPTNSIHSTIEYATLASRSEVFQYLLLWSYIQLAVISAILIATLTILGLVCIKVFLRVVKGNQSLGISLLVGIIMLNLVAYLFVANPSDTICRLRVVFYPLGHAICFGVIIAKATQLKNSETIGFSNRGYISYWNYWLLLLFIIGVQIALSLRWLAERFTTSIVLNSPQYYLTCAYGDTEFLSSQVYVIILLILALFISSRIRNIKRNYKEAKWLLLASLTCLCICTLWIISYYLVSSLYKDFVVVIELVLCSTALLGFLFGPKLYILMSYETVVVEYQSNERENAYEDELFEPDMIVNQCKFTPICSTQNCSIGSKSPRTQQNTTDEQSPVFKTIIRKKTNRQASHPVYRADQTLSPKCVDLVKDVAPEVSEV